MVTEMNWNAWYYPDTGVNNMRLIVDPRMWVKNLHPDTHAIQSKGNVKET